MQSRAVELGGNEPEVPFILRAIWVFRYLESVKRVYEVFFDDVEVVKENIVAIRNATTRVGEINQQVIEDIRNLRNSCCVMRIQILKPLNRYNSEGGLSHD